MLVVIFMQMIYSGNYILNGRTAFLTFFVVGDDHNEKTVNKIARRGSATPMGVTPMEAAFDPSKMTQAAPWMTKEQQEEHNASVEEDRREHGPDPGMQKWQTQEFELLLVISYYHDQDRHYVVRICEGEWALTRYGKWMEMDEERRIELCNFTANVLCSHDSNSESQVIKKISSEFLLTDRELTQFSKYFKAVDYDNSGQVDLEEFVQFYQLEDVTHLAEKLFTIFDTDGTRDIDQGEFLCGMLSYLTMDYTVLADFAFNLANSNNDTMLDRDEVFSACCEMHGLEELEAKMVAQLDSIDFPLTQDEFKAMVHIVPELLYPAFNMQERLQRAIMGEEFWVEYTARLQTAKGTKGTDGVDLKEQSTVDRLKELMATAEPSIQGTSFPSVFTVDSNALVEALGLPGTRSSASPPPASSPDAA
jgi:Ca2+-binding EF-hand superfamily protein